MTFPAAPIARQVTEGGEIYIVRKAKYFFGSRGGGKHRPMVGTVRQCSLQGVYYFLDGGGK